MFIVTSNFAFAQAGKTSGRPGKAGNQGLGSSPKFLNEKFELAGRSLLNNPFLDSLADKPGRIILNSAVDSLGNVIEVAGLARGSTSSDSSLLAKAKAAAFKAKFSAAHLIPKQVGRISFTYYVKRKD